MDHMHPSNKEGSSLQSSVALSEQTPPASEAVETAPDRLEQAIAGAERAPIVVSAPPLSIPAATTIPLPVATPLTTPSTNASAVTASATLPADDGDVIEKEWVARAKQIVERTRDDPDRQSEDLTLFKSD